MSGMHLRRPGDEHPLDILAELGIEERHERGEFVQLLVRQIVRHRRAC